MLPCCCLSLAELSFSSPTPAICREAILLCILPPGSTVPTSSRSLHGTGTQMSTSRKAYVVVLAFRCRSVFVTPHHMPNAVTFFCQRGGDAPLHLAAWKGHITAGRMLVECGADINVTKHVRVTRGWSSFTFATLCTDVVWWHVCSHFCVAWVCSLSLQDGATPLHLAASSGQVDIARWLVEELECLVNAPSSNGDTPLHLACWRGRLECAQWLATHGGDIHSPKHVRFTCARVKLCWAAVVLVVTDACGRIM